MLKNVKFKSYRGQTSLNSKLTIDFCNCWFVKVNKDKLFISQKLQLFGIYYIYPIGPPLYIYRKRKKETLLNFVCVTSFLHFAAKTMLHTDYAIFKLTHKCDFFWQHPNWRVGGKARMQGGMARMWTFCSPEIMVRILDGNSELCVQGRSVMFMLTYMHF